MLMMFDLVSGVVKVVIVNWDCLVGLIVWSLDSRMIYVIVDDM